MKTAMKSLGLVSALLISASTGVFAQDATVAPGSMAETSMGTALVDPLGMPLYTYESDAEGKSACNDDCAQTWIPLAVPEGATPMKDWSIVVRDDGTRMWAYKGQPVYTYSLDTKAGLVTGESKGGFHLAGVSAKDLARADAAMVPVATMADTSMGLAWVDSHGMPLYTYEKDAKGASMCNGDCAVAWPPLLAAEGSVESPNWTIVVREDGTKMWALMEQPLYTYRNDTPGVVTGDNVGGFHLAK